MRETVGRSAPARRTRGRAPLWHSFGATALALGLAGCNHGGIAPQNAREALQRVNDNLAQIQGPLYCGHSLVSFRFRDDKGHVQRFIGHPATLIFAPPRCLYFDVKHTLGGSVARIGSNDERYWMWVDPEVHKLWWGSWARHTEGAPGRLLIPPDQLLDALLLRPLAESLPEGLRPLLRSDGNKYRLDFVRIGDDNWPYVAREVTLDPRPPYQPLRIVDRLADGRIVMDAELGRYARVGSDGPYTPRRYVIRWPLDDAELRLDVGGAKFRPDQPPFCEFPYDWQGDAECVDTPPADELSLRAQGELPS